MSCIGPIVFAAGLASSQHACDQTAYPSGVALTSILPVYGGAVLKVKAGQALYLPALWFHQVKQRGDYDVRWLFCTMRSTIN
jgi:hypothetical protein